MYFACWLALSAPSLTILLPLSSLYNSLQDALKIPECSACSLRVIPGYLLWLYWLVVSSLAAHDGWCNTRSRSHNCSQSRGGHWLWSPGCGHFGWRERRGDVTSSLISHFSADTRRSHICTVSPACLSMSSRTESDNLEEGELTEAELEFVTTVFKSFETGLREATIYPKVNLTFR